MRAGRLVNQTGAEAVAPHVAAQGSILLSALTPATRDEFLQLADFVSLRKHEVIYSASRVGDWAYFPVSGVLGGFTSGVEGAPVQAMLVGPDGVVGGLRAVLGVEAALLSVRVTVAGEAFAMRMSAVRTLAERHRDFREAIERCALRLFQSLTQHVLCARLHTLAERASTWLLIMSYHSAPRGVVRLTHEELAEIVGASRPSLSVVISELAEHGLIEPAGRGRILIDDGECLSARACECWALFLERAAASEAQISECVHPSSP